MMFVEPFVFDPRPALVPCGTAANSAAVAGKPCGHRVEVLPLVGEHAADRTRHCLNQTHDIPRVRGRADCPTEMKLYIVR